MLSAQERMRSPIDFGLTVRGGVRAGRSTLVVHARRLPSGVSASVVPVTVGFVVPKAVGGAVVRNRVKRRLRHLARVEVARTPPGTQLVVRALPSAASSDQLAHDLASAWCRCLVKLAHR